ncbi:MAG: hypothetical protein KGN01_07175, partial [Patescibacteria group bacterium]|nr:hypothetical protein [Patescibacteria group bacterium]
MSIDNAKNFSKVTVSAGYDAVATSIVLSTGDGAKLPTAPFNVVWWDSTTYSDPSDDPNVEIVRVTNIATDTLTVTRAQESTSASTKNTVGKTYKMIACLTAKTMNNDIAGSDGSGISNYIAVWSNAKTLTAYAGLLFTAGTGLGVFTAGAAATKDLEYGGGQARTWWVGRNPNAATAGQNLTIQAGGAVSGGTNLAGGDLILSSGISTGTGTSNVYIYAVKAGSSGTTDNNSAQVLKISGSGTATIGVAGTLQGSYALSGATSGTVTLTTAAAAGTWSLTLPTTAGS